jgi:hypothetical protein
MLRSSNVSGVWASDVCKSRKISYFCMIYKIMKDNDILKTYEW